MELRQLRYFVALAEELHFSRAARRLNISQPPLSMAIQKMEEDLGTLLVKRDKRNVKLTEAGSLLYCEALEILRRMELAENLVKESVEYRDILRIGVDESALFHFIPSILARYGSESNSPIFRVRELPRSKQIEDLLVGNLDVAFIYNGVKKPAGLLSEIVEVAPFVAAVPADWELGAGGSVTLAELSNYPFINPSPARKNDFREDIGVFEDIGFVPESVQEARRARIVLAFVNAGLGWSVTPASAEAIRPPNVKFLEIGDVPQGCEWALAMIWAENQSDAAVLDFVNDILNIAGSSCLADGKSIEAA